MCGNIGTYIHSYRTSDFVYKFLTPHYCARVTYVCLLHRLTQMKWARCIHLRIEEHLASCCRPFLAKHVHTYITDQCVHCMHLMRTASVFKWFCYKFAYNQSPTHLHTQTHNKLLYQAPGQWCTQVMMALTCHCPLHIWRCRYMYTYRYYHLA